MKRSEDRYGLFDTVLGVCAIAWNARGISCVILPDRTPLLTENRLRKELPGADRAEPPRWIAALARRIASHLAGKAQDFRDVALDMTRTPPFYRRVYERLREVRSGSTVTYAELARRAGSPRAARAIGRAMAKNPFAIVVPCHRVLCKSGEVGGFSALGGSKTKLWLLAREGVGQSGPGSSTTSRLSRNAQ